MAGLDGLTTQTPNTTTDYSSLVNQAYANIGRTGFGSGANQIDQPGFDYWTNQLQSGAMDPSKFQSAFMNAAANYAGPNANQYQSSIDAAKNQISSPAQQVNYQLPAYTGNFADEQAQTAANQAAGVQTMGGLNTVSTPNYNDLVTQEYRNIGRTGFGNTALTIDQPGFDYWTNQLQSGNLALSDFHKAFTNAAYDVIQADANADTSVSDKTLSQYFDLHPESRTAYITKAATDTLGSDYSAPTGYNNFKTDLDNRLSTNQITASQYANELQNSTYNKAQEANRIAGIGKSLYGMTDAEAVQLAKDVYQGNTTSSPLASHYQGLLTDPNKAMSDILTERANASDAATNPYFQQNPDMLSMYKNVGDTRQFNHGGAGGQYGYYQGKPILKASEVDQLFNDMGTDYIRGNAAGKADNDIGWDSGSLGGVTARGAGAFGIQKQGPQTDENGNVIGGNTYSGDMNALATKLGIDPNKYQDTYKTVDQPTYDQDGNYTGTQRVQVLDKSGQDALYDAINDKTKDFVFIAGKSGKDAGGVGAGQESAAFQNATGNHAAQMFKKMGDKYIPVGETTYYNGDMELHHGGLGALAPILSMAAMAFAPELALAYGGGTAGAIGAGATLGAGSAALGGGNIIKGGLLGGAGGYLGSQIGDIGKSFSSIGITDPGIQNILARGSVNLGLNIAGGAPLENALLNTGVNTGINLGLNAAGVPNTPATNFATSVGTPLLMTGRVNPMTVANSAMRTIQQSQPRTSKEGGLISMKSGGKVPHYEDGGGVDWGSFDYGDNSWDYSVPTYDASNLGFDLSNFDIPSFDISNFDISGLNTADLGFNADVAEGFANQSAGDFIANDITNLRNQGLSDDAIRQIVGDYATTDAVTTGLDLANSGASTADIASSLDTLGQTSGLEQQTYNDKQFAIMDAQQLWDNTHDVAAVQQNLIASGIDPLTAADLANQVAMGASSTEMYQSLTDTYGNAGVYGTAFNPADRTFWSGANAGTYDAAGNLIRTSTGSTTPSRPPTIPTGSTARTTTPTTTPTATRQLTSGTTAPSQGGIANLAPGLTKANLNWELEGLPTHKSTGGALTAGTSGLDYSSSLGSSDASYDPYATSSFTKKSPTFTKRAALGDLLGMPKFMRYANGGDVQHKPEFYSEGGLGAINNRYVKGRGDGTSDSVPAMLANGEFVIPADVVSGLGNGSNDSGAKILDEFLKVIRRDKRAASPDKLPADSKGPQAYLLQAKRKVRK